MSFDLGSYLRRIGFHGEAKPDLATLAALQKASVETLPFEGLDPFLRRPVSLDLDALQEKIVRGRRGGYCYELNTLFQAALEAIGFSHVALGGRVRWMSPPEAPLGPREHMLLKVETPQGAYLADVGFGAYLLDAPLPLAPGEDFVTPMGAFRLREENGRISLIGRQGEGWRVMYVFDLEPQLPADLALGNWYTSTSATPPFQHVIIMERIVGDTRRKIINRRYIVERRAGVVESEREISRPQEMEALLAEVFGVVPPIPVAEWFARVPA